MILIKEEMCTTKSLGPKITMGIGPRKQHILCRSLIQIAMCGANVTLENLLWAMTLFSGDYEFKFDGISPQTYSHLQLEVQDSLIILARWDLLKYQTSVIVLFSTGIHIYTHSKIRKHSLYIFCTIL